MFMFGVVCLLACLQIRNLCVFVSLYLGLILVCIGRECVCVGGGGGVSLFLMCT